MPDIPDPVAREPSCRILGFGRRGTRLRRRLEGKRTPRTHEEVKEMATRKQTAAGKRNIKKARAAAKRQRTIAHLPAAVRKDMGRQAARARARGGKPGRGLEDRTRQQLYDEAKRRNIPGRSKMGKWDLVEALRKSR